MGILLSVLIGLLAGYLGSALFKGKGSRRRRGMTAKLLMNLVIGIVGGFIGGSLFGWLGIGGSSLIWQLVSATTGAIILLWVVSLIRGR